MAFGGLDLGGINTTGEQIDIEKYRGNVLIPNNRERLERICEEIKTIWEDSRPSYPFTSHDDSHCERVEEKIYQLIPLEEMKKNLNQEEKFLLLASVWLHDIGNFPHLFKDDKSPSEVRGKPITIEWDKKVRESHAERSARWVLENGGRLKLTKDEIANLARMCKLHRHRAYSELHQVEWLTNDKVPIRIQLLIAYLRLADALHIPRETDTIEFKIYLALGLDNMAKFHWFKSKYTHNISVSPEEFRIRITLKRPESKGNSNKWEKKLTPLKEVLMREVLDELDPIKDILTQGGLSVYLIVDYDFHEDPTLSDDDIKDLEELLNNIELFNPTFTPNASSVIASVLKTIKLFLDPNKSDKSITYLKDYKVNVLNDILEKRPCHVFLWKISEMLERILQNPTINDEEKVKAIKGAINKLEIKRENAIREIPKKAYSILGDGNPILLYGYSDTVVKCIEYYLKEEKKGLDIYICEGRTKTIYRYNNKLVYCDAIKYAEELKNIEKKISDELRKDGYNKDIKIKIHYVTDICASNLFSKSKISKVLFGANGIGLGGRISHTLGHLAIADMASIYKVPVYVIADSTKIGFLREKSNLLRDNPWLTTDIGFVSKIDNEYCNCNPKGDDDPPDYNPREDVVPPDKIQLIVTEKGAIVPADISKHAENGVT